MISSTTKPWTIDIVAVFFSILIFLALIVVLATQDGKPLFSWHGVTLNAIVSVLSTASKALLLLAVEDLIGQWKWILFSGQARALIDFERIDAASRGPLGSLRLMWNSKKITFLYFGSFTVLISLAIDPFTQQLVQTREGLVTVSDEQTTVVRADRYSKGNWFNIHSEFEADQDFNITAVFTDADFSMQSAVLYGINERVDAVTQQSPFKCPTGNCTWPAYESLAVCSQCYDVSSGFERIKKYGTLFEDLHEVGLGFPAGVFGNSTVFRLPNGLMIDNLDGWNPNGHSTGEAKIAVNATVLMTTLGTGNTSQTVSMQAVDTLIWSTTMLRTDPDPKKPRAVWPNIPVMATECAVFYCVKKYETAVTNGVLVEHASRVANTTRSPNSWLPLNAGLAKGLREDRFKTLQFDHYFSSLERSDLMLVSGASGRTFNVSQSAIDSISSFFQQTLATGLRTYNKTSFTAAGQLNGWYLTDENKIAQYKPSLNQALYSTKNLAPTFTSLAASMSNALRRGADDNYHGNSKVHTGEKEVVTFFYRVEWPWIVVHGLSAVLGSLFIALTIWKNRDTEAWGSSSLATMSRGVLVQHALSGARTVEEMEAGARKEWVTLLNEKGKNPSIEDLELDPLQEQNRTSRYLSY